MKMKLILALAATLSLGACGRDDHAEERRNEDRKQDAADKVASGFREMVDAAVAEQHSDTNAHQRAAAAEAAKLAADADKAADNARRAADAAERASKSAR